MGWKNVKEHYNLDGRIVYIDENGDICIGDELLIKRAVIRLETNSTHVYGDVSVLGFTLNRIDYDELKSLINTPDQFEKSLPVYTYKDGVIVEKQCEEYGWPNVTHDGCLMRDDMYSKSRAKAVKLAKRYLDSMTKKAAREVSSARRKLERSKEKLLEIKKIKKRFNETCKNAD
ncbi:hypothetical protein SAMN05216326_12561 [Nitrosomonas marina]|uniref:Uncharacterized protein n=1 Tax=Nitrosomonas marina TaxID=917 RepID=A0A1I0E7X4_9PROT|nr:hypothetical protein [Nitrosomonas marina]SET41316.1 hypothetical protein SAMN05216326_12561 [Nitrosomonas marina]